MVQRHVQRLACAATAVCGGPVRASSQRRRQASVEASAMASSGQPAGAAVVVPSVELLPAGQSLVADGDTGHGGLTAVMKLTKMFVEAGAAGVHFEDQAPGTKKCGHVSAATAVFDLRRRVLLGGRSHVCTCQRALAIAPRVADGW